MISSTINSYPNRITEAREIRKLNMTSFADQLGITKQAISRYELGLSHPSAAIIHKMAESLNFPESFFINLLWNRQIEALYSIGHSKLQKPLNEK